MTEGLSPWQLNTTSQLLSLYSRSIKVFSDNSSCLNLLAISAASRLLPPPVCLRHRIGDNDDDDDDDEKESEMSKVNNLSILKGLLDRTVCYNALLTMIQMMHWLRRNWGYKHNTRTSSNQLVSDGIIDLIARLQKIFNYIVLVKWWPGVAVVWR